MVAADSPDDLDERRFRDDLDHGAPPRGARQLTAILPNGRTLSLRVAAPLAPAVSVNHVAQLAQRLADRGESATVAQVGAIERLSDTVISAAKRLDERRLARARALCRRIVAGDNAVDARLAKARDEFRARLDRQMQIDRESVRRLRRRDLWDKILIGSSLPLFAAYGDRDDPFGSNNLTLTVSLLIFLAGDQVVDALFGSDAPKSPYALEDADAWSYIAPVANLLAGWWLLGGRQHERFVSGVTTVKLESRTPLTDGVVFYRYRADVDLTSRIGKDHLADFVTFSAVPAVATVGAARWTPEGNAIAPRIERLAAKVDEGILRLTFRMIAQNGPATGSSPFGDVDIAWIVDTRKPSAAAPPK